MSIEKLIMSDIVSKTVIFDPSNLVTFKIRKSRVVLYLKRER